MSKPTPRRKSLSVNISSSSKPPKKPIIVTKIGKKVLARKSRRGPDAVEVFLNMFLENNDAPYAPIDYYLVEKCVRFLAKSHQDEGTNLFATKKMPMGDVRTLYKMWNRDVPLEEWPISVVAAVLKVYLKLQEEPIVPHKFYEHFKQLISDDSKDLDRQFRLVKETFKSNGPFKWVCALFLHWRDEKKLQTFILNEMVTDLAPFLVNYSESPGGRSTDYFEEFPEFLFHTVDKFASLFDAPIPDLVNGSQSDAHSLLRFDTSRSNWDSSDESQSTASDIGFIRTSASDSMLSIGDSKSMPVSPIGHRRHRSKHEESPSRMRWSGEYQDKLEQAKKVAAEFYWNQPYKPLPARPTKENTRRYSVAVMEGDHKSSSSPDLSALKEEMESGAESPVPTERKRKKKSSNKIKMTLLASYKDDNGRTHNKELTALPITTLHDIVECLKETPEGNININSINIKIV